MEHKSEKSKYKFWPCYIVRAGIRWTHRAVVVTFKRAQTHGNKANSLDWKARFVCKKNAKRHVVSLGRGRCFCLHTCTDKPWNEDKAAYRISTPIGITNAILYRKKRSGYCIKVIHMQQVSVTTVIKNMWNVRDVSYTFNE